MFGLVINRFGTVYPCGSNKGFSSKFCFGVPDFDMKLLKKAERHIGRNVVRITKKDEVNCPKYFK